MVLSEAEAEAQLAALRRQREALDRAIGDLTLYLELGRRLTAGPAGQGAPASAVSAAMPSAPVPQPREAPSGETISGRIAPTEPPVPQDAPAPFTVADPVAPTVVPSRSAPETAVGAAESVDGALSEGVLARRYGRALIEAALAALEEAGRPLHAGEILAVLTQRGFALPGHDPVAALNTRLWKRSGPGGPLRRMGDAVYALAEAEDEGGSPHAAHGG